MGSKKVVIIFVVLVVFALMVGSFFMFFDKEQNLEDVTLKLKWVHQAQFAGNYVAKEKGFYADEGLNIILEEFSFENPTIDAVINGDATFGITSANEIVMARSNGLPLQAFAVIYKISPDCAYSLKESEITIPQDFVGKTVGIEPGVSGENLYYIMMDRLGINRSEINEIYIGYDATELLSGGTDVSLGYVINEPHQVIEAGHEVNIIMFSDYGAKQYADVLFATEDTINNNPELVESFLKATLDGWRYAFENREEAVDIVLEYATDRTRSHETYMLEKSMPLIHTGESVFGMMEESEWENVQIMLLEEGTLEEPIELSQSYTFKFLNKIYNE